MAYDACQGCWSLQTLNTLKVKQPQVEITKYASRDYNSDKKCLSNLNKRSYNNTVYHSPLLITILSIAVQSFVG